MDFDVDMGGLLDEFDDRQREVHRKGETVVRAVTARGEALSKQFAPVRTGFLRSSVTSDVHVGRNEVVGQFGPEASYSPFVHNGTSRQAPNPFNDRALDAVEPVFYAAVGKIAGGGGG